jgi:hypothetical protein
MRYDIIWINKDEIIVAKIAAIQIFLINKLQATLVTISTTQNDIIESTVSFIEIKY